MLAEQKNFVQLRRFAETFAMEHLLQRSGGKRRRVVVFDVDGLPVEAHGRQQGSKWNGYYKRTIFLPLVALCGKTGDMLGARHPERGGRLLHVHPAHCAGVAPPCGTQGHCPAGRRF